MIYNRVPFVVLWYCGACLLDPGLIYDHVKNLLICRNERPMEGLTLLQQLTEARVHVTVGFLCLLKMTRVEELPTCCFLSTTCSCELVIIQCLSPPV